MWKKAKTDEVDPTDLVMDDNNRFPFNSLDDIKDIEALKEVVKTQRPDLWDSIPKHGVKDAIRVNPLPNGKYRVRDGHWRTLVATFWVDVHPLVPILITDDDDTQPWYRTRDQYLFNELGKGYTDSEKAEIVGSMALFDLSAEDIASELSMDLEVVKAGLVVQRSPKTMEASRRNPQWDMFHLQAMADFADDPDAHDQLVATLQDEPERFDSRLAQLHRERQIRRDVQAMETTLRERGVRIVDVDPADEDLPENILPLHRLYVSADDSTVVTVESHEQCPGRAAAVTANWRGEVVVTHLCVDFAQHGHRDKVAAAVEAAVTRLQDAGVTVIDELPETASSLDSLYDNATDRSRLTAESHAHCPGHAAYVEADLRGDTDVYYICQDFAEHGHVSIRGASATSTVTDEYRKGERNRATVNNAKWDVAIKVRRKWLAENIFANAFGKKAQPPSRAQHRITEARMVHGDRVDKAKRSGHRLACQILGLKPSQPGKPHPIAAKLKRANQTQALMMDLAVLLGGLEEHYDHQYSRTTWRTPTEEDRFYFLMLKAWGYPLEPVEQLVLDPTADAQNWPHLNDTVTAEVETDKSTPDSDEDVDDEDAVDDAEDDVLANVTDGQVDDLDEDDLAPEMDDSQQPDDEQGVEPDAPEVVHRSAA